jgi:hypothetical protein
MTGPEDAAGNRYLNAIARRCVIVSLVAASILSVLGKTSEAVSFLLGASVSMLMLASSRFAVARIFRPGVKGHSSLAFFAAVARWGVAAVVVWLTVRWEHSSMPAFAAGATVLSVVLFAAALADWRQGVRSERLRDLTRGRQ